MNAHANLTHWTERTDMAAAFRWTVKLNLHEAVANHFSLAVNPEGTRFLINPNGRHFGRITASSLVEIDANDPNTMDRPDAPDPTAWGLHGSIHRALPHARCVMHVHSMHATVLASLADSRLPPIDQNSAMFFGRHAVDDSYGPINGASGVTTPSVLVNDTLNGVSVDPTKVTPRLVEKFFISPRDGLNLTVKLPL